MPMALAQPLWGRPIVSRIPVVLLWPRELIIVKDQLILSAAVSHQLPRPLSASSTTLVTLLNEVPLPRGSTKEHSPMEVLRMCAQQLRACSQARSPLTPELFTLLSAGAATAAMELSVSTLAHGHNIADGMLSAVRAGGWMFETRRWSQTGGGVAAAGAVLLAAVLRSQGSLVVATQPWSDDVERIVEGCRSALVSVVSALAGAGPIGWLRACPLLLQQPGWRALALAARMWEAATRLQPGGLGVLLLMASSFSGGMVVAISPRAHPQTRQTLQVGDVITHIQGAAVTADSAQALLEGLHCGEVQITLSCEALIETTADGDDDGVAPLPDEVTMVTPVVSVVALPGFPQPRSIKPSDAPTIAKMLSESQAMRIVRKKFVRDMADPAVAMQGSSSRKDFGICWSLSNPRAVRSLSVKQVACEPCEVWYQMGCTRRPVTPWRLQSDHCCVMAGVPTLPGVVEAVIRLGVRAACVSYGTGRACCDTCGLVHEYVHIDTLPDFAQTVLRVRERLHLTVLAPPPKVYGHVCALRELIIRDVRKAIGQRNVTAAAKMLSVHAAPCQLGTSLHVDGAEVSDAMTSFGLTLTPIGSGPALFVPGFTPYVSFLKCRAKEDLLHHLKDIALAELASVCGVVLQIGERIRFEIRLLANASDHKAQALMSCLEGMSNPFRSEALLLPMWMCFTVVEDDVFFRGGPADIGRAIAVAHWWRSRVIAAHIERHGCFGTEEQLKRLRNQLRYLFAGLNEKCVIELTRPFLDPANQLGPCPDVGGMSDCIKLLHDGEKGIVPRVHWTLWAMAGVAGEGGRIANSSEVLHVRPNTRGAGQEQMKKKQTLAVGKAMGDGYNGRNWAKSFKLFRSIYEANVPALSLQMPQLVDLMISCCYASTQSPGGWLVAKYAVRLRLAQVMHSTLTCDYSLPAPTPPSLFCS